MEFSFDKQKTQDPKVNLDEVVYLDPATNRPIRLNPNSPVPKRMRFSPAPRRVEDRE